MEGTISQWGNSRAVRIPKQYLDKLGLKEDDKVEILLEENVIMIKPLAPKLQSLDELFQGYTGNYRPTEYDFRDDVGREKVWD